MTLSIVILAAGQGKRMCSRLHKVLHQLAGTSLLERVIATATTLNPTQIPIVIHGHQGIQIQQALSHLAIAWVEQKEQLGTGHAVLQALPNIPQQNRVLVLYGDVPLVTAETLQQLITTTPADAIGLITAFFPQPTGLGRIIRNQQHQITQIVEEKDANATERAIHEINSGIYLIPATYLQRWLPHLTNNNQQQEFYLTEIITKAAQEHIPIYDIQPLQYQEVCGINDCIQLATLERFHQQQCAEKLMKQGVTLLDPQRFDLRGELKVGTDCTIDINVIIEGKVTLGNHCKIGANSILRNTIIADHVEIKANCFIDGAIIADHCIIGPFAHLRPETELANHVKIGNFVEIKKSRVNQGSKINHLSYIGDSEIGKEVNIGAGVITCNYDGVNKHKTIIDDHAFIGSNSQLIAPVKVGTGATIGAGSTIYRDAPANQLTLCRAEQRSIPAWQRPKKKAKES